MPVGGGDDNDNDDGDDGEDDKTQPLDDIGKLHNNNTCASADADKYMPLCR